MTFSEVFFNSPLQILLQNERETRFLPAHKSSPPTRLKYLKIISKFYEMYSKALFFFQGNLFINTFKIDIYEVLRTIWILLWYVYISTQDLHFYKVSIWNQGQTIQWNVGITNIFQNQIKSSKEKYRCKANTDLHKNQSHVRCRSKQPLLTVYTRYALFVVLWKTGNHRQSGY